MGSMAGSANSSSGKAVMSTPAPPPYLSSSAWSSASVAGLASTMAPPASAFLVAYSWILDTNSAWMGSEGAAAAMAGVFVLRHLLAKEREAARRDIMAALLKKVNQA